MNTLKIVSDLTDEIIFETPNLNFIYLENRENSMPMNTFKNVDDLLKKYDNGNETAMLWFDKSLNLIKDKLNNLSVSFNRISDDHLMFLQYKMLINLINKEIIKNDKIYTRVEYKLQYYFEKMDNLENPENKPKIIQAENLL